jgi:AcrR family transcriptional regulator
LRSIGPKRKPAAEPDTKTQLVEAGERLFGLHGLEGVSLRQIAAAVGSSNSYVVQYHFGDKEALCRAIFVRRLPSLEARRGALLAKARQAGRAEDPRVLLEVILQPMSQERDREGRRTYAAFLLGLRSRHSLAQPRREAAALAPLTEHLLELLRTAVGPTPLALFRSRMLAASTLYWHALADLDDQFFRTGRLAVSEDATLGEALDAGVRILAAPVLREAWTAFVSTDE